MLNLLSDPKFLEDLNGPDSIRTVSQTWGVSFGWVQKLRTKDGLPLALKAEAEVPGRAEESGVKPNGERYLIKRGSAVTMKDWREWIALDGDDPEDFIPSIRSIAYGVGVYSNRLGATPKLRGGKDRAPKWPVVQPAAPVTIPP